MRWREQDNRVGEDGSAQHRMHARWAWPICGDWASAASEN